MAEAPRPVATFSHSALHKTECARPARWRISQRPRAFRGWHSRCSWDGTETSTETLVEKEGTMFATIAWLAPLIWGAAAFITVLALTRRAETRIEKHSAPARALPKAA